jgi:hypothetical protein
MKHATAVLIAGLMRKETFADQSLERATAAYLNSRRLSEAADGVHTERMANRVAEGVIRVRCTTHLPGLRRPFALRHRFAFPLLNEVRETGHVVVPDQPFAASEILIALGDDRKGYFNIGVHDDENSLIATDVLTYDRNGRLSPYKPAFTDKFVSPLDLGPASLGEAVDEGGRRVLRLTLELRKPPEGTAVKIGYNALGVHEVRTFEVSPVNPVVVSDLPLDDNPHLQAGEWIIGATDAQDCMLVNGIVWLSARSDMP